MVASKKKKKKKVPIVSKILIKHEHYRQLREKSHKVKMKQLLISCDVFLC